MAELAPAGLCPSPPPSCRALSVLPPQHHRESPSVFLLRGDHRRRTWRAASLDLSASSCADGFGMDQEALEVGFCSYHGLSNTATVDGIFKVTQAHSWVGHAPREIIDGEEDKELTNVEQVACPQAPLTIRHYIKSYETEHRALTLLISDGIHPGICGFFPYSRRFCFKDEMDIDISDVLYSNGEWFLVREENVISFWNINLKEKWFITEVNEIIHQGYFSGKPPFDGIIILAVQHPPKPGEDAVTYLWLRSLGMDVRWQEQKVKCSFMHRGLNSIILYQDMVLWLSDNGSLCFVKQSSAGLQMNVLEGACISNTMNFSLVEHFNKLYIVKSGGFLPYEVPGIYEIIPGSPMVIQERRLYGKDIFVVHKQGGFMIDSSKDNCRIFTGSMLPDVDCAMFNYKNDCHEKIKLCESPHHLACSTVWSMLRTVRLL